LQRGLELADVANEVEVPSKALRAIEWDRLDLLDDPSEADPILRRYAAFLEVDRPQTVEEPPRRPRRARAERVPEPVIGRPRSSDLVYVIGAFVNVLALAALVYVLADPGSEQPGGQAEAPRGVPARPIPDRTDSPTTEVVPRRPAPQAVTTREPAGKAPLRPPVRLTVTAALGDSWIEARAGSSSGPVLFDGTLARGRPLRLSGRRLWLRLGAASNLVFVLNGRQVGQELLGTVDVVATPRGIGPAY
jgi:hypothetical protein